MPLAALYDWLMLAHVLAAMVWFGGGVLLAALAFRALGAHDLPLVERFVANLRFAGTRVLAPAMVAVAGFGVWMVLDSPEWDFEQGWVELALALIVAAFLVGTIYQSRRAISAERAIARGAHQEARSQLVHWLWGYLLIVALLLVATYDMVMKPAL